jgi:hypothetical protein
MLDQSRDPSILETNLLVPSEGNSLLIRRANVSKKSERDKLTSLSVGMASELD